MRWRVAAALVVVALGAGYWVGYEPPPRESGPGAALRAYQNARLDALSACAKHGFATTWGDVRPDSRVDLECRSILSQPCGEIMVPDATGEEPTHGPRL